ncbi:hypothetical protein DSUL_60245 [Desulfovibrionales bacterium]
MKIRFMHLDFSVVSVGQRCDEYILVIEKSLGRVTINYFFCMTISRGI